MAAGPAVPAGWETADFAVSDLSDGTTVEIDLVLVATGRVPNSDDLGLERAGVDTHPDGRIVVDAGSKILGADRAAWATGHGRLLDHPDARVVQLSEHHAVVEFPAESTSAPRLGDVIRVVPNRPVRYSSH